jgi:hypothetical protein
MTPAQQPASDAAWSASLTPARPSAERGPSRRRTEPEPAAEPQNDTLSDLDRGRSAALMSTLGRFQVSLDVLTRKVADLDAKLDRIESMLAEES